MTRYEHILQEVTEASGVEIRLASDRVAELMVDDTIVLLKPLDATEESVSIFTVILDGDADDKVLRKAMELNLFGRGTGGGIIGLFVDSLVYSRTLPLEGVSAGAFGEALVSFARKAQEIASGLSAGDASALPPHVPSGSLRMSAHPDSSSGQMMMLP
ncbi:MAG: type III secretion system chaperone [Kiritimatiellae bacterium]|nr:type III secretion system chaperone [Kiritimatiellia bacterium]